MVGEPGEEWELRWLRVRSARAEVLRRIRAAKGGASDGRVRLVVSGRRWRGGIGGAASLDRRGGD